MQTTRKTCIVCDVDGVLVDFRGEMLNEMGKDVRFHSADMGNYHYDLYGDVGTEIRQKAVERIYKSSRMSKLPMYSGAVESFNRLSEFCEMRIVTACPEEYREEREANLSQLRYRSLTMGDRKEMTIVGWIKCGEVDAVIDDRPSLLNDVSDVVPGGGGEYPVMYYPRHFEWTNGEYLSSIATPYYSWAHLERLIKRLHLSRHLPKQLCLGISGKCGSGKDAMGEWLRTEYGFSVTRISIGIKKEVAEITCTTLEQNLSEKGLKPRGFEGRSLAELQVEFGEKRRIEDGKDVWLDIMYEGIKDQERTVITDVRLLHEVEYLESRGVVIIRVERPMTQEMQRGFLKGRSPAHQTEVDLDNFKGFKTTIVNDGELSDLQIRLDKFLFGLVAEDKK